MAAESGLCPRAIDANHAGTEGGRGTRQRPCAAQEYAPAEGGTSAAAAAGRECARSGHNIQCPGVQKYGHLPHIAEQKKGAEAPLFHPSHGYQISPRSA